MFLNKSLQTPIIGHERSLSFSSMINIRGEKFYFCSDYKSNQKQLHNLGILSRLQLRNSSTALKSVHISPVNFSLPTDFSNGFRFPLIPPSHHCVKNYKVCGRCAFVMFKILLG